MKLYERSSPEMNIELKVINDSKELTAALEQRKNVRTEIHEKNSFALRQRIFWIKAFASTSFEIYGR